MAELALITDRLAEAVDGLQESISNKPWRLRTRQGFVYTLKEAHNSLSGIVAMLQNVKAEYAEQGKEETHDLKKHLNDLNYLLEIIEINRKMEEEMHQRNIEEEGISIEEQLKPNESHAVLEERVANLLLKTRHIVEKVQIEQRKEVSLTPSASQERKNLVSLLEKKESEFQQLKERYEELRNKSYLGRIEAGTSADRELEWADLTRQLVSEHASLAEGVKQYSEQLESLNNLHQNLQIRFSGLEELSLRHAKDTNELIRNLKKERDYAKRIVTDIEHETFKLRSLYSKELLNLENEKSQIRDQAAQRVKKKISSMQRELDSKTRQLDQLHKKVGESERRLEKSGKRK